MATFLFWNINRKPLSARIARIAAGNAVDVVILAECELEPSEVVASLNSLGYGWESLPSVDNGIRVFSRLNEVTWHLAQNDAHWSIYRIESSHFPDCFIAAAHLLSKLHSDKPDQELGARSLIADIRTLEREMDPTRTILVGDLNMNPFEDGITGVDAIHGVMSHSVAIAEERTVQRREYEYFYNPMWGLFGDRTPGPPGTYFANSTGAISYFWHMLDQVLVRPSLMGKLKEVRILDSDGSQSLLTKSGRPDRENGSDHLPLLFRIDLK